MWALRRAYVPLKSQASLAVTFQACYAKHEIASSGYTDDNSVSEHPRQRTDKALFVKRLPSSALDTRKDLMGKRSFSFQAGAKSSGEEDDDFEDGFSELETSSADVTEVKNVESEIDNEVISEADLSESEDEVDDIAAEGPLKELELSDAEGEDEAAELSPKQRRASSGLFKAIIGSPSMPVQQVLDKWVAEGNNLTREEISMAIRGFRKRKMFGKALQLSECLESRDPMEFNEGDYASRVDLIAKVRGLDKAENYIEKIPESFRGERVYRTLLASCVASKQIAKAQQVFKKMKSLKFPLTAFACNQMLLLYKRTHKNKMSGVLSLMEEEKIEPTLFTYRILIDAKGQSNDIAGMEKIAETMKADEIEPDIMTRVIMARHYAYAGLKEKAEAVLKEIEGSDLKDTPYVYSFILPIYATLGSVEDIKRLWKVCESNPRLDVCMSALNAWGRLKNVEEAEAVFELMSKKWKRLGSRHYGAMLKVYAKNKMLSKGKDLVKRMSENGGQVGPVGWDGLVELYVEAGEIEKADTILNRASQKTHVKPFFSTYIKILDQYAKRGDVHNAEKIFHRMRQVGYVSRPRQYHALLQTYINAKKPAYGFYERMKADNLVPNKFFAAQLAQVDAFKKTAVSDLLE